MRAALPAYSRTARVYSIPPRLTRPASRTSSSPLTRSRTASGVRPSARIFRSSSAISSTRARPPNACTSATPSTWRSSGATVSSSTVRRASAVSGPVRV